VGVLDLVVEVLEAVCTLVETLLEPLVQSLGSGPNGRAALTSDKKMSWSVTLQPLK
jgi:hypothetical protein